MIGQREKFLAMLRGTANRILNGKLSKGAYLVADMREKQIDRHISGMYQGKVFRKGVLLKTSIRAKGANNQNFSCFYQKLWNSKKILVTR